MLSLKLEKVGGDVRGESVRADTQRDGPLPYVQQQQHSDSVAHFTPSPVIPQMWPAAVLSLSGQAAGGVLRSR